MIEKEFYSFDGTKLYMVKDEVEFPKAVAIIVHGLCEHLGRYDYLSNKLNEAGIMTYRFDHRGHGRSEGKRTFYSKYTEISDDVNAVVEMVKSENQGLKIFVIGHSMGGHASASFATRFPGKVNGIVLAGALTRGNNKSIGPFPIPAPDDEYVVNGFAEGVCSDPEIGRIYKNDPLVEKKISIGLLNRIAEGVEFLKEKAGDFSDPVFILHGACDGIVSEKDSRELYGDISSKDKTLKIYAKLFHEILNEPCKDEIIDEIVDWLQKHI